MELIFSQYSLISSLFHYFDHCDLLTFGSCSKELFNIAKHELHRKYPSPVCEVTDYLISLRSHKHKRFDECRKYLHNDDIFCIKKGIRVTYKIIDGMAYLFLHSMYGHYMMISLGQGNDSFDEIDSQTIHHFNFNQKTLIILTSPLFNYTLVDISEPSIPILCPFNYGRREDNKLRFAAILSVAFSDRMKEFDWLDEEINCSFKIDYTKSMKTFNCKNDYINVGSQIVKILPDKNTELVNREFTSTTSCCYEDRFFVGDYFCQNDQKLGKFIVDIATNETVSSVVFWHFEYIGNYCIAHRGTDKKLRVFDMNAKTMYESVNEFRPLPLGCQDGINGYYVENDKILRISNILGKIQFRICQLSNIDINVISIN